MSCEFMKKKLSIELVSWETNEGKSNQWVVKKKLNFELVSGETKEENLLRELWSRE